MIKTREELLGYAHAYITRNFNEEITGPILKRLLVDIIDTLFSLSPGVTGTLIKAPGNIQITAEIGDWRVRIDENKDLHKEKYTVNGWEEHEIDKFAAT